MGRDPGAAVITAHHGLFRDTRLHVDDTGGSGRPVLLTHAWPLSGEAWAPQVEALHDSGYRVIAFDLRGFGRSDKPLLGYTYDRLTADVHTLAEALHLDDVSLVGFSMGGGEVARYLKSYGSERPHSIVFASAVTPYMLHTSDNPDGPLTKQDATRLAAALVKDAESFYQQQMTEFFSVNGELAVSAAQRSAKRTHDAIRGSELCVIADVPHGCNLSHPDEFNEALLEFLARV